MTASVGTDRLREVLDGLVSEFLQHYGKGRTLIAIDGADAAVTADFADAFAARLGRGTHAVFRASLSDFQLPTSAGTPRPQPLTAETLDISLLRRVLIEPFRLGGSTGFVTAGFDAARDVPFEPVWSTGPQDATLVVDGVDTLRPELRGIWNWSVSVGAASSASASALVDLDPWPRRIFADHC
jgi:uridine kinase